MMTRVILIVGLLDGEDKPLVAGCIDPELFDIIDYEEGERLIREVKEKWSSDPADYEWRIIPCDLPTAQLRAAFDTPVVEGKIVP